jgi:hypothetical protein
MGLDAEIRDFVEARRREGRESAQRAALQIVCGLDLQATLAGSRDVREKALAKAERMVRRERQRGALRHWSYDLNRHIALKQVCDRLRATLTGGISRDSCSSVPTTASGRDAEHREL